MIKQSYQGLAHGLLADYPSAVFCGFVSQGELEESRKGSLVGHSILLEGSKGAKTEKEKG